jgi:hypothetical protein
MKKIIIFLFLCILVAIFHSCADSDSASGANISGQGGLMARFAIHDDYLYIVDNENLKVVDVATASKPKYLNQRDQKIGFDIETIFAQDTLLFIGSQEGMHIYTISRLGLPQKISTVTHIRSCDRIVAQGGYAYVALNSNNSWRGGQSNQLVVYNIKHSKIPLLVYDGSMTNPKGLGVDGDKLFVCDKGIIRVYNIGQPESPKCMGDLSYIPEMSSAEMYDVIPMNGILMAVGNDGFYQFDYTQSKISFISKISVKENEDTIGFSLGKHKSARNKDNEPQTVLPKKQVSYENSTDNPRQIGQQSIRNGVAAVFDTHCTIINGDQIKRSVC